jgi:arabinofuranosyltransferase
MAAAGARSEPERASGNGRERNVAGIAAALIAAAVVVALGALFVWELRSAGAVAVDDAYITFSYSKNLATGHGPVYGHGVRVEGYSNFLWMVVVGIGLLFTPRADPLLVARTMAAPFMALLAYATYRLARVRAGRVLSVAAVVLLVLSADLATAFLIGLETLPSTALLALAFMVYARSFAEPRFHRWVVPAFVAVGLSRIDGFVPLGFVLGFEAARRLLKREGTVRDYVLWAAPALAIYLAWFGWRWAYYGLPLPTTYYAKALIPTLLPHRGWEYVRAEMMSNGWLVALPFAALLIVGWRRRAAGLALALFAGLHVLYVVKAGGDWMPYGRFLLPILPLVAVIVVWGGAELADRLRPWLRRAAPLLLALPAAALLFIAKRTERHLTTDPYQLGKLAQVAEQASHIKGIKTAARLLSWAIPPGGRLVTEYGGIFAYYTDAAPIEMWGLCNEMIATKGGTEGVNAVFGRTCPECYPKLDPQFFHIWSPIARSPDAFHAHMDVVNSVWQTDTIRRYVDFQRDFVTGRSMMPLRNLAVFFLERRRPGVAYRARAVNDKVVVDYPFEPGGRAIGL